MSSKEVEIIARGVMVSEGRLLVCHTKGANNTYLPGGHIDPGEGAKDALKREIAEEMGCKASVSRFLGCCEHGFVQKGVEHFEINLIFEMEVHGISVDRNPDSEEDYIEFFWLDLGVLNDSDLEPASLRCCLGDWLHCGGTPERWASNKS